jgi:tryptophan 2,3-dioxygenase
MVWMMTYIKEGTYTLELLEMDEVPPKIKMIQKAASLYYFVLKENDFR